MMTGARKYLTAGLCLLVLGLHGCGTEEKRGDEPADTTAVEKSGGSYDIAALMGERSAKDEYFRQDGSPIPEEHRKAFPGLQYFPADPALSLDLAITKLPAPEPVTMTATKGDVRAMSRYGKFSFTVNGTPCTLTAFTSEGNPNALFVPFKDETNGEETYEVGRYIDLELREDGRYRLDFNLAYNPYCAYNPGYTCPMVPQENILPVAIRAGEKLPAGTAAHP